MSDESIINLSDSTKATMRNYAMVMGFMTLFIYSAIVAMTHLSLIELSQSQLYISRAIIAIALMISGSILAFLHKRDLVSITFLLISVNASLNITGFALFGSTTLGFFLSFEIVAILLGIAMLFTRNEQKYICSAVLIPKYTIALISDIAFYEPIACIDASTYMTMKAVGWMIIALVSVYAVLCIGLENPRFPGYGLLTADEDYEICDGSPVHFKVSGSVLGYMLLMIPLLTIIFYKLNLFNVGAPDIMACNGSCGILLFFVGFLMLIAGRMKFTPFMFMMLGIILAVPVEGARWLFTISFIIIGILCIFRSDRKILVGIAIILHGLLLLFTNNSVLPNDAVLLILSTITFVIFAYVCFALCSDDRLKLI